MGSPKTVNSIVQEPVTMLHYESKDTTQRELSLQTLKLRVLWSRKMDPMHVRLPLKLKDGGKGR